MNDTTKGLPMTPNEIGILIHCYVSPDPHPRMVEPAVRTALYYMETEGLVELRNGVHRTTERGMAHVAQLCALPLPRKVWVGADDSVIVVDAGGVRRG